MQACTFGRRAYVYIRVSIAMCIHMCVGMHIWAAYACLRSTQEGPHLVLVVTSTLLIAAYVIGIPVVFAVLLDHGRRNDLLKSKEWLERFGFLYRRYENQWNAPWIGACYLL